MQRISVHISDETKQRIDLAAKAKRKLESELIRDAIDAGLNVIYPKENSAQALLNLAKLAEQIPTKGKVPTDVSENHDFYAWGGGKKTKQ